MLQEKVIARAIRRAVQRDDGRVTSGRVAHAKFGAARVDDHASPESRRRR